MINIHMQESQAEILTLPNIAKILRRSTDTDGPICISLYLNILILETVAAGFIYFMQQTLASIYFPSWDKIVKIYISKYLL